MLLASTVFNCLPWGPFAESLHVRMRLLKWVSLFEALYFSSWPRGVCSLPSPSLHFQTKDSCGLIRMKSTYHALILRVHFVSLRPSFLARRRNREGHPERELRFSFPLVPFRTCCVLGFSFVTCCVIAYEGCQAMSWFIWLFLLEEWMIPLLFRFSFRSRLVRIVPFAVFLEPLEFGLLDRAFAALPKRCQCGGQARQSRSSVGTTS